MRIRHGVAVLAVALLLAACSQEVQGVASPGASSPPPSSGSPAPPPQSPPEPGGSEPGGSEPGGSEPDTGDRSGPATPGADDDGDGPRVSGINFRSDDSSARLTVNLSGSGVPEWTVAYSEATGPDGEPIDIAGDAFLRVRVRSDVGGGSQGSSRLSISPGPVAEARTTGAADGYEEVLIGMRGGERPFTVDVLTDPGRLVIDVTN
ncbi:AMIN-like domain-containing (lipo)protein [Blastococcus haudaquaticus]|uniref:AMIN-like domain-containing protein n=1 Tax=Blastococcus haudaquaticus TaxID=1938745 RepID=A0A286GEW9_9ACTN|nr:hypothetical protein [Blastococcus haudaquaticus]SOD94052.1 hypothetical protein SAMN06272739_0558 [Blastococcus haudaquaticus]